MRFLVLVRDKHLKLSYSHKITETSKAHIKFIVHIYKFTIMYPELNGNMYLGCHFTGHFTPPKYFQNKTFMSKLRTNKIYIKRVKMGLPKAVSRLV